MGWSVGRGYPLPTEKGVWGGGYAPSPEFFLYFFGSMCSQNFCVQAKGGGPSRSAPPPKYVGYVYYYYARRHHITRRRYKTEKYWRLKIKMHRKLETI